MVFWALSGGMKVDYVTLPFKGLQCSNRVLIQGIDQHATLDALLHMIQERVWSKHKYFSLNILKKYFQQWLKQWGISWKLISWITLLNVFSPSSISANLSECQKLEHDAAQIPSPLTVQSPIEAFLTNSPLKSLVASPQLRSKQNQVVHVDNGTRFYHYLFLDDSTFKTWIAHSHRSAISWKLT